jgi:hypothetical protein
MQALKLPARRGWLWLLGGFAIFRKNPPVLTMLVVSYWMLIALLNLIPVLGALVATLCIPAFSVSLMNACRELDQGRTIGPQFLFSGFRQNLRALLMLGGIYLGATIAILGVSAMADGGLLLQMMLAGKQPSEEALGSGQFLAATQLALLLFTPLMMAYWYAPALAAWHGFSVSKALFFSFVACLRNWRAFLAYAAAMLLFGILLPGFVLGSLAAMLPDSVNFFGLLFTIPIFFVLVPTVFASFYVSYREVFVSIEADA